MLDLKEIVVQEFLRACSKPSDINQSSKKSVLKN
jgi:hypothetical protein